MRGLLVRQVPVRLVNVSLSGFLLESANEIGVGTTGELRVQISGSRCRDQVRVARSVGRAGSANFYLGGEFSWGVRPENGSVRKAVRVLGTS